MSGATKYYISLFTGAGGLDIGFNEAGFSGLMASDKMPQATGRNARFSRVFFCRTA